MDVFGALSPACGCAACQCLGDQRAVFVIDVAHAGFLGFRGRGAPEAFKEGGEACPDVLRGGFFWVGDGV